MALTSWVPDIRHPMRDPHPGLGVVPQLRVIPHFDRFVGWMPDLVGRYLAKAPAGVTVLGIDEDTALVGDGSAWNVHGRQSVWVLTNEGRIPYRAGDVVPI
jgi:cyanophycinase